MPRSGFSICGSGVVERGGRTIRAFVGLILTAATHRRSMNDAERRLLQEQAAYVGPVIEASRPLLEQMQPMPLCVVCPSAQWYRITDDKLEAHLECFCTEFRGVMFDRRKRGVTACDGRSDAIERDRKRRTQQG